MVSSVSTQTPGHGVAATPIVNRACTILHRPAPLPKAGQRIAAAAAAAIPDTPAYTLPSTAPPPPGSFDAVYRKVASLPDLPGGASRRLPRYARARGRPAGAGVAAEGRRIRQDRASQVCKPCILIGGLLVKSGILLVSLWCLCESRAWARCSCCAEKPW